MQYINLASRTKKKGDLSNTTDNNDMHNSRYNYTTIKLTLLLNINTALPMPMSQC